MPYDDELPELKGALISTMLDEPIFVYTVDGVKNMTIGKHYKCEIVSSNAYGDWYHIIGDDGEEEIVGDYLIEVVTK